MNDLSVFLESYIIINPESCQKEEMKQYKRLKKYYRELVDCTCHLPKSLKDNKHKFQKFMLEKLKDINELS